MRGILLQQGSSQQISFPGTIAVVTSQPVQAEEDVNLEKALQVFTGEGRSPTTGIGSINPSCKCNVCYIEPERCSFHAVTSVVCYVT